MNKVPKPTPEQVVGMNFLADRQRAVLGDDTGFGKTVQVLGALSLLSPKRVLYVTGVQVASQVKADNEKFDFGLSVRVLRATKANRVFYYKRPSQVTVVSYGTLLSDVKELAKYKWDVMVLDDASKFKNPHSKRSKVAAFLGKNNVDTAWALTATPIESSLTDLWAVCNAIGFYPFGTLENFYLTYTIWGDTPRGWDIVSYKNFEHLRGILATFFLRRESTNTPDLRIVDHFMPMCKKQFTGYRSALGRKYVKASFNKALMACDIVGRYSSKIDFIESLLPGIDGKVIIYSMWMAVIDALHERLAEYRPLEISGRIPIPTRDENQRIFLEDPDRRIILVTTAAEQGLNLQSAQYMICVNRFANPQRMRQTYGRMTRHSSEFDSVTVINLIIKGSIEEGMLKLADKREQVYSAVIGGALPKRLSSSDKYSLVVQSRNRVVEVLDCE